MSLASFLYDRLSTDATISGLVGTKIFPDIAPQDERAPYITYSVVSRDPHDTKSGASEWDFVRVQIEAYSTKHDEADTIKRAVRARLDRFAGTAGGETVTGIQYLTEMGLYLHEVELFLKAQDFKIQLQRTL